MSQTVLLAVISVAAVTVIAAFVMPNVRLRRQAAADFRRARGTQHRVLVTDAVAQLNSTVATLRNDLHGLLDTRSRLDGEERAELDTALAHHLVKTRLTEIPGVGRARAAAIESTALQRSLADLHQASWKVPGIGEATQAAISSWVNARLAEWTALSEGEFEAKQAIIDRYSSRRVALQGQEQTLGLRITELEGLIRTAETALRRLGSPSVDDFAQALRGTRKAESASMLEGYLLGLFPPWSKAPAWFNRLIAASQETPNVGRSA